jgi:hypothetical protein
MFYNCRIVFLESDTRKREEQRISKSFYKNRIRLSGFMIHKNNEYENTRMLYECRGLSSYRGAREEGKSRRYQRALMNTALDLRIS